MAHELGPVTMESCPEEPARWHECANLFPMLTGKPYEELRDDIAEHGIREPVVFLDGAILDGRNRYMAARELGIEYPRVEYEGNDPAGYVVSLNLRRRHLNESQRSMVAAKLAKMPRGNPEFSKSANLQNSNSQADAAQMLNVSERSVATAKAVEREGSPELVDAVEQGKVSVSTAEQIAKLPFDEQMEIIKAADPKARNAVQKEFRAKQQAAKKQRRVEREQELADKITTLPDKKYGVIVADPEWEWESYSEETGMDRAAANHYPTSPTLDIMQRNVQSIAADDCVLFLWATAPRLPDALATMEAWGFCYKTNAAWKKVRSGNARGTGYWFTGEHEHLLLGVKGRVVAPAPGTQFPSVFEAPVGKHSEKPDRALEIIETYFPSLPKIELNRRGPARDGWDAWGNEVEVAA